MVPRRGLEPRRACAHQPLKLACLPIPPPRQAGRGGFYTRGHRGPTVRGESATSAQAEQAAIGEQPGEDHAEKAEGAGGGDDGGGDQARQRAAARRPGEGLRTGAGTGGAGGGGQLGGGGQAPPPRAAGGRGPTRPAANADPTRPPRATAISRRTLPDRGASSSARAERAASPGRAAHPHSRRTGAPANAAAWPRAAALTAPPPGAAPAHS